LLSWSLSFLIILPQVYSTHGFFLEGFQVSCTFDYFSRDLKSRILLFYMVILGYLMPLFVIFTSYVKIYSTVKAQKLILVEGRPNNASDKMRLSLTEIQQNSVMLKNESQANKKSLNTNHSMMETSFFTNKNDKSVNTIDSRNDIINLFKCSTRFIQRRNALKSARDIIGLPRVRDILIEREIRVAKMVLVKILLFCFSWSPYVLVIFLAQFTENIAAYVTPVTTIIPSLFAKSSIIFNALVYTLSQKECNSYYFGHISGQKKNN
jgi:hypothetical protein